MRVPSFVLFALAAVGGGACHDPARTPMQGAVQPRPANQPPHHDEPAHQGLPQRVRLDPQVIVDAEIKTLAVTRESLAATLELPGEISFDPDRTAKLSALVGGRIESVHFKEGQRVEKGALLAVIKVPELGKAKAAFTATAAKASAARSNADRLQALAQQRLAATQEVLAAIAEANALESEARAAGEQLQALGTAASDTTHASQLNLRAPISGDIVSRDAVVGQPVAPDQVIATIADLREVWFLGRVFEKNLGQIQVGAAVEIQLNAYPHEKFSGSVDYLGKQVDPTARAVTARIRMANRSDLLRIGLFGVARVATGAAPANARPAIVVPRSAVTEIGNKPVVFVRQPDGDFDVHEIVLGDGALGKVQVLNGLREGEQVVVDGVFSLKSAVLKSTFGEAD
jgi:cobalt-zinc-cadmium efflux system membrane fusion protein